MTSIGYNIITCIDDNVMTYNAYNAMMSIVYNVIASIDDNVIMYIWFTMS